MPTCKDCEYYEKPVPTDAKFYCNKKSSHYREYSPCKDFDPKENNMNKELQERIEKLKKPELARQVGWLRKYRPEEYSILEMAGYQNRLRLFQGQWANDTCGLVGGDCVILKPDYQPEPEYEEIEIVVDGGGALRLKHAITGLHGQLRIDIISSRKNFVCFHDPFGKETTNAGLVPGWMRQLAAQDDNLKMYARFVRSKP